VSRHDRASRRISPVLLVAGPLGLAALTRRPRPTWRELGFARGVTVRDPDGHALEMVEP